MRIDGRSNSTQSVTELQKLLNLNGYKLVVDGVKGSQTKSAQENYEADLLEQTNGYSFGKEALWIAGGMIGQKEISNNMGFQTEWYYKLMKNVGFGKGQAWCAYAAESVWRLGAFAVGDTQHSLNYFYDTPPKELALKVSPRTRRIDEYLAKQFSASVQKTRINFTNGREIDGQKIVLPLIPQLYINSAGVEYYPLPGSLAFYVSANNPNTGHITCFEKDINGKSFYSVEGNTNAQGGREGDEFARKTRSFDAKGSLLLQGFINPFIPIYEQV